MSLRNKIRGLIDRLLGVDAPLAVRLGQLEQKIHAANLKIDVAIAKIDVAAARIDATALATASMIDWTLATTTGKIDTVARQIDVAAGRIDTALGATAGKVDTAAVLVTSCSALILQEVIPLGVVAEALEALLLRQGADLENTKTELTRVRSALAGHQSFDSPQVAAGESIPGGCPTAASRPAVVTEYLDQGVSAGTASESNRG